VTIEGSEAFAKFGGGGQGDVPTVRGAAIIPDGGSAIWTIKVCFNVFLTGLAFCLLFLRTPASAREIGPCLRCPLGKR
jgi:hypothetical protein